MTIDKRQWRERFRAARDALPPEERARRSRQLCEAVLREALEPLAAKLARPLTVCAYGAFRSEADPEGIAAWCAERGYRIAATRVRDDGGGLELRAVASRADWKTGRWGVPEPDPQRCPALDPGEPVDAVLVPGLAFDRQGGRLGYGGGYYDRLYAARTSAGQASLWIGFAFELQVADDPLPKERHDLEMDGLATENGLIWFGRRETG